LSLHHEKVLHDSYYSPIAGSTQLSVLHVDRNRIKDMSQIEQLTSLTSLKVSENPIQNMEPIRKLLQQIPDLELDIPAPEELNILLPPNR
jgi:Leucine-rich repeat (LRR) protein